MMLLSELKICVSMITRTKSFTRSQKSLNKIINLGTKKIFEKYESNFQNGQKYKIVLTFIIYA